jgi:hypothetical protein
LVTIIFNSILGKRKRETIDNLMARANMTSQELEARTQAYQTLQNTSFSTSPILNDWYVSHFNAVDLHDRYLYSVEYHHPIQNWRTRFLTYILSHVLVNCWILYQQKHPISFVVFRRHLAEAMLSINE